MFVCKELSEIIQTSEKHSMISFIYENEGSLRHAQSVLIDLGMHLLEFCDFVNEFATERYYKILEELLRRAELDLAQIKIEDIMNKSTASKKLYDKNCQMAAQYQLFMYQLLKKSTDNMRRKGVEHYKRNF